MTMPQPEKSLTMDEIRTKLAEEYGDALRVLGETRGPEAVETLVNQIYDHDLYNSEVIQESLEQLQRGEVVPYIGRSAQETSDLLSRVLVMLTDLAESDQSIVLSAQDIMVLIDLFQDALGSVQEHFNGPDGRPVPVLDRIPCPNEVAAADLAEKLLTVDDAPEVQVMQNGAAVIIELHVDGQHVSLSNEFSSLPKTVAGLRAMADQIEGMRPVM